MRADGDPMNMFKRRLEASKAQRTMGASDDGSALIMSLVAIIVATLIVTPMLTYAVSVTRASRLVDNKAQRLEAVKGGLRTALADPVALFKACNQDKAGVNLNPVLASPSLRVPVATTCALMAVNYSEDETKRPYGTTSLQAGIALPGAYTPSSPTFTRCTRALGRAIFVSGAMWRVSPEASTRFGHRTCRCTR